MNENFLNIKEKKCLKCLKIFPLSFFHKVKNNSDGRRNICPPCRKIYEIKKENDDQKYKFKEWSEDHTVILQTLRKNGISYPIIANILKRSIHSVQVKSHKLGFTTNNKSKENLDLFKDYSLFLQLDSNRKGTISEQKVFLKLLEKKFDVFIPFVAGQEEDCIIKEGKNILRVQIKTASMTKDYRFRVSIVRKRVQGKNKGLRMRYENIDFFIFYVPIIETFYIIPENKTRDVKELNLFPHRSKTIIKGKNWEIYREAFHLLKM
jgi:hypothetical protein